MHTLIWIYRLGSAVTVSIFGFAVGFLIKTTVPVRFL